MGPSVTSNAQNPRNPKGFAEAVPRTDFLDSATSGDLGPEIVSDFMQAAQEIIDTLIITAKEAEVK